MMQLGCLEGAEGVITWQSWLCDGAGSLCVWIVVYEAQTRLWHSEQAAHATAGFSPITYRADFTPIEGNYRISFPISESDPDRFL